MTDDKIALRTLLEKGSDATFLREMIGFAAQRLMKLESEALCGAGHGERSAERRNQRNGYRDRDLTRRHLFGNRRCRLLPRHVRLKNNGVKVARRFAGTGAKSWFNTQQVRDLKRADLTIETAPIDARELRQQ